MPQLRLLILETWNVKTKSSSLHTTSFPTLPANITELVHLLMAINEKSRLRTRIKTHSESQKETKCVTDFILHIQVTKLFLSTKA